MTLTDFLDKFKGEVVGGRIKVIANGVHHFVGWIEDEEVKLSGEGRSVMRDIQDTPAPAPAAAAFDVEQLAAEAVKAKK
jgi:hypothetical protein